MPKLKKILAPTDFSELSTLGIRHALEAAREVAAEVIVYHVIDFGSDWTNSQGDRSPYHDIVANSSRILDRFLVENFADCIDLVEVRQLVEFGAPYKNIVSLAASENVDLIVMATHGRTGLDHLLLGSVTEKVIARAPCPVLIVPPHGRAATLSVAA